MVSGWCCNNTGVGPRIMLKCVEVNDPSGDIQVKVTLVARHNCKTECHNIRFVVIIQNYGLTLEQSNSFEKRDIVY